MFMYMPDSVERHNGRQASTDDLMNFSDNKHRTAYHPALLTEYLARITPVVALCLPIQ